MGMETFSFNMFVAKLCRLWGAPHNRHSFASNLFKKGVDVKVVSELLGHADIKTTYNIYIHLMSDVKQSAIQALEAL